MTLSILIATVKERESDFKILENEFKHQIITHKLQGQVDILSLSDNKEISIGAKRQQLLESAIGEYIAYFDDDDFPYPIFLLEIMQALKESPDCVGMLIHMTTNGQKPQTCCHSLKYKQWADRKDGYDYVRNVTHFNPVRRLLALQVGFKDMRFGEDKEYSDRLTPLCKTEIFINKKLFHYRYKQHQNHNQKYGIT